MLPAQLSAIGKSSGSCDYLSSLHRGLAAAYAQAIFSAKSFQVS
jgi:hypothetical protein